jgi:hypothetical protein
MTCLFVFFFFYLCLFVPTIVWQNNFFSSAKDITLLPLRCQHCRQTCKGQPDWSLSSIRKPTRTISN